MNARILGQLEIADELHDRSMRLADDATLLTFQGRQAESRSSLQEAFELEREAADLLSDIDVPEPSRSVFHSSATSLAIRVGELDEADRPIEQGLRGQPPGSIATELEELRQAIHRWPQTREREFTAVETEQESIFFPKAFVVEATASYLPA